MINFFRIIVFMKLRILVLLITFLVLLNPCLADPIPSPPPPTHPVFIQLTFPLLVNYLWNFLILSVVFTSFGIKVKSKRFPLFILVLTLAGLVIDIVTFFLKTSFLEWILIVGILLFALSYSLTKLFYKLSNKKCTISGVVYAIASHPLIGITFLIPILARF
jgi:hypothetical protein